MATTLQCLCFLTSVILVSATGPILDTHLGKFEGAVVDLGDDGKVERYLGIPYAKAPKGELRFEKPVEAEHSAITRSALKLTPGCKQPASAFNGNSTGNEDCLTVGVIRPLKRSGGSGYPAFVFIHGGAYQIGSSAAHLNDETARNFAAKGIVFIAPQYRLSAEGFASNGSASFSGNYGLWDLREALLWVNRNAKTLDIDPSRITVGGHSAGSSATGLLTLSEHTRDLFSQAIQISGSALANWSASNNSFIQQIAAYLKCEADVKRCLQKIPYERIIEALHAVKNSKEENQWSPLEFSPRLDSDFFSADMPKLVAAAPPKPTLISSAVNEGIIFTLWVKLDVLGDQYLTPQQQDSFGRKEFAEFVHLRLATDQILGDKADAVTKEIVEFYLKDEPKDSSDNSYYLLKYAKLISDLYFGVPMATEVQLKTAANWPVYQLLNSYNGHMKRGNYQPMGAYRPLFRNSTHGMEHGFLFGNDFLYHGNFTAEDVKFRDNLVDAMVNFIKNKTPKTSESPNFEPTTSARPFVYSEVNTEVKVHDSLLAEEYQFWEHIAKEYGYDLVRSVPREQCVFKRLF